jgi:hypothetical protein
MRIQRRSRDIDGDDARRIRFGLERFVRNRVEHRDRAAVDVDRVRDEHLAADRAAHPFGNHRLAVAGSTVEEDRLAGVHRRPELLENRVGDDQVRKSLAQPLAVEIAARRRQRAHVDDVVRERHRRRPDVAAHFEILQRTIAPQVSQRVAVCRRAAAGRAADFDEPLGARPLDERLENPERQAQAIGDDQAGQLAAVQRLHEQLLDLRAVESGVRQRGGDRRRGDGFRHRHLAAIGMRTWTNLIAAGPIVTTQIAGKMQNTSGNTIFTPVFAAASSARWRRLVRTVSEWTRSDCATLVPNLSVWTSIATSD